MEAYYRVYELAWSVSSADEQRFRKILLHVSGVLAAMALLMPLLPVREIERNTAPELPPRLAKLVLERKAPPPPPPPVKEEKLQPKPEQKPKVEPKPEPKPKPKPALVREEPKPKSVEEAREKAAKSGLMALADDLADLREHAALDAAGSKRDLVGAVGAGARNERSLITSKAGAASGGINTAALSRNTGGGELSGRAVTQVAAPVALAQGVEEEGALRDGRKAQRSREEIEMVFDRHKAAIYALYHRALRNDPTLQGKLVLRLTIAPSGKVVDCEVVSSELAAPELERKLVQRVKLFDFGAKDVGEVTTTKPIDFFPA